MLLSDFYLIPKNSYYTPIDKLSFYIATSLSKKSNAEVVQIAAEVLFLLAGFGKKLTRRDVSDLLYIPYTNLQRPLELLKKKNLIQTKGKKFIFTGDFTQISTEESIFEVYVILYGDAVDWYSNKENHYALINLMNTIATWVGLGVPISERRRLTKCLCFDCFNCCSNRHWAQAKKDLLTIKKGALQERFDECNYSNKVLDKMEFRKEKNIRFHYFNLAKQYLYILRDKCYNGIRKSYQSFIDEEMNTTLKGESYDIRIAVRNAMEFFPDKPNTSSKVTMDKRIKYLLEYLVYQPISGDKDFNPFSPFYGKDLETRLSIIQDTIGKDAKYYKGIVDQPQFKAAFNCTIEGNKRISLNEERKEIVIYKGRN